MQVHTFWSVHWRSNQVLQSGTGLRLDPALYHFHLLGLHDRILGFVPARSAFLPYLIGSTLMFVSESVERGVGRAIFRPG
jgi:hypothetical protein